MWRSSAFGHILEDAEDLDEKKLSQAVEQAKKKQCLGRSQAKRELRSWELFFFLFTPQEGREKGGPDDSG